MLSADILARIIQMIFIVYALLDLWFLYCWTY